MKKAKKIRLLDVEIGPTMRCCLDVIDCASDLLKLLPPAYTQAKLELTNRLKTLNVIAAEGLKTEWINQLPVKKLPKGMEKRLEKAIKRDDAGLSTECDDPFDAE